MNSGRRYLWRGIGAVAVSVLGTATAALAGTTAPPDWVTAAAHAQTPAYPADTNAVVLEDAETVTVQPDGKAVAHVQRAIKILRPPGREYGTIVVPVDKERRARSLHAWSIGPDGHPFTLKESDFLETTAGQYGILYNDLHLRVAKAPGADPGAVVAYEFERTLRPYMSEYTWGFQEEIPILHSSFELDLPPGWKYYTASTGEQTGAVAQVTPNHFRWEVAKVPGIDVNNVPLTPDPEAMAGRMVVHYASGELPEGEQRWTDIGNWYSGLADEQGRTTPEIAAQAQKLTAGEADFTSKLQSITEYMQRNIRYVGIEIGIGGLQPHAAGEVFHNRYGDCKDKATLLRAMLDAVGIHATWVLVDTRRGLVNPRVPSLDGNHAIAAIEIPASYTNSRLQSVVSLKNGKRYLIFDPTDEYTPVGQIRPALQGGYGILVEGKQSQLIALPVLQPDADVLERVAKCKLSPDGSLQAEVTENRFGAVANGTRRIFVESGEREQREALERRLREDLAHFSLGTAKAQNETKLDRNLVLDYDFSAADYAKMAGNLLLFRPRVLGSDALALKDGPRTYAIELGAVMTRRDRVEVTLPAGYVVDELPEPLDLDTDFASYHSSIKVEGSTLRYSREYVVKRLSVEPEKYEELRKFSGRVAYDEASTAVLKKQ